MDVAAANAAAGSAAATLLLFDVDGTLVSGATLAHSEALYAALREVHGIDPRAHVAGVSPAGRTDGEIARLLLLSAGVDARRIDERAGDVREACCREYAQRCPSDLARTVLPGVRELLGWLAARDDVLLSLVTGNYEPVARLKLRRAGLGSWFPSGQGGFGSDSEDRAALPAIARRRAGESGVSHPRERTIVIGDTPRDIACARADEVRCLAVATGNFAAAELVGADAVADDATALRQTLAALLD
ncbi:MAG: haloacid dehalogenase-like hydrolase [Solirubrobacteraceae bacterium]